MKPSSCVYGYTDESVIGGVIPIAGAAGRSAGGAVPDSAALRPGKRKNTYGTGCFLLSECGGKAVTSQNGLLTTIAASTEEIRYALEGSVFVAGSSHTVAAR